MENIMEFIRPELFVLVVFLYCVGLFLKKMPWFKADWAIPLVLWAAGMVFAGLYVGFVLGDGFAPGVVVAVLIQGTLLAAVAVFGNELITQITRGRAEDGQSD